MSESPKIIWPFSERNGAVASNSIESLLAAPEITLTDAEKQKLYKYADQLVHGERYQAELPDLEEVNGVSTVNATEQYYTDFFDTQDGMRALGTLGITQDADRDSVRDALYAGVAEGNQAPLKDRRSIATQSLNWYKESLRERLLEDPAHDRDYSDSPVLTVIYEPDKILKKIEHLQTYRMLYRLFQAELKAEPESSVHTAKQVLLNVHIGKINNMMAEIYPRAIQLAAQLNASTQTPAVQGWQNRLLECVPVMKYALESQRGSSDFNYEFTRRLDLIRNGAYSDGSPDYTPIDNAASELADAIEAGKRQPAELLVAKLPDDIVEAAMQLEWNATELKGFLEILLQKWELISTVPTDWEEVAGRNGRAADNKWQVVVTPRATSLSVDGIKKVMFVPESFNRKAMADGRGALPVSAHELAHVLQNEAAEQLADLIPITRIKGRRSLTGREMGGIYEERLVYAMFGLSRSTGTTYLRGLEAKLAGKNQTEAARAFMDASMHDQKVKTEEIRNAKAKIAGRNILRLYRRGGNDSQALDYIEQELLLENMHGLSREQVRAIAINGTSFSLQDAAALHAVGFLEIPDKPVRLPADDVVDSFIAKYMS